MIVIGHIFQDHLLNLWKVFQRFQEARLELTPKKCQYFQKEVQYLVHITSHQGITTVPKKLKTAKEWPTPKEQTLLKEFLVPMHLLQAVYFLFRETCYILEEVYRGEANLPVNSRSWSRLENIREESV
jgi:hypothetical protein